MNFSEKGEAELAEAARKFYDKKQLVALAISYFLGSALGALLRLPTLAAVGVALTISSWFLFRNVMMKKIEALRDAWDTLLEIKGLETKAIQNPDERDRLLDLAKTKYAKFKMLLKEGERVAEEVKPRSLLTFALYGLGAGLVSSSLASALPRPFSPLVYGILSLIVLAPATSMVGELGEVRV